MRPRRRRPVDWGDDRGQVAGIEAIPFGVLVFVVGALVVSNAWGVVDAKLASVAAAREAARTYVEVVSGADSAGASSAALAAARDAIAGHGRDPSRMTLTLSPAGAVARCVRVTADVSYPVPAIRLPWIGGFGEGFVVHARHSEVIDPFRSGVAGEANCA